VTSKAQLELRTALGEAGWITGIASQPYTEDWLKLSANPALGVARPNSTEAVADCVRLCREHHIALVPQGGKTGMVLGSVPGKPEQATVILSLERMHRIEHIDPIGGTVCVEAGVVLDQLQQVLGENNLQIPLHLGSSGSAQIGGLISTNAGGSHAFRDGMMAEQVLGLEVVLPSGDIWQGNRALLKDNAGYALRRLFCGAEGTLGIVTRATLQAVNKPADITTLLLSCENLENALALLGLCRAHTGKLLNAAEFMHAVGVNWVTQHCRDVSFPLESVPPYTVLLEFVSPNAALQLEPIVDHLLSEAMQRELVSDGVQASSEQQRAAMWALRESIPEGQRLHGRQLKHDVAVPVAQIANFIAAASAAVQNIMAGTLVNPFGHMADGNVHFNLSPPAGADIEFFERSDAFNKAVYDTVVQFNGSIAAEHGLGRAKVALADRVRPEVERALMRTIKAAIDPSGFMNPGVIVHMDNDSH